MTRDRLVYKTALSLATIATSGLVRLVFSLLVGHVFDAPLLGHANVIVSTAVFATLLCSPGMGQAVARHMATRGWTPDHPAGRALLVKATVSHHVLCAAVAVAVGLLAPTDLAVEHVLAAALTFGYGTYTYYKAVLYGVDQVRRYAVLELTWDTVFLVALIAVVVAGQRSWVLAPMVLIYGGFSVGAHRVLLPGRRAAARVGASPRAGSPDGAGGASPSEVTAPGMTVSSPPGTTRADGAPGAGPGEPPRPDGVVGGGGDAVWWRAIGAFALVTTVGTASSAGFLQLSQVFAARAGGDHAAGLFAAAMSLVTPAYLLPRAVSVVLFPAMARAAGRADHDRVRVHLTVGTQVLAAALLPLFVLAGVLATSVLTAFYGRGFADGGLTLTIMVWATWVSIAAVPSVNALSSGTGRTYLIPAGASAAGFAVGLVAWLAWGTSIEAVAWGYLIGSVIQSAVPVAEATRRHRSPSAGLSARTVVVAAAGLVVALSLGPIGIGARVAVALGAALIAALVVWPELRALSRIGLARKAR